MGDDGATELPIFELPLVLLPTEQLPLHIFEERYKRMVGHCLASGEPFGIVFRDDAGARALGCTATVSDVVERFDDGRLNVVVVGGEPFRVLDRFQAAEYPAGRVETLEPPTADPSAADPAPARAAFAELLELVGADEQQPEASLDAYSIAARVELPVETKQRLLESRDEDQRLELLTDALRELAEDVRRSRALAEIARSNGHGGGLERD